MDKLFGVWCPTFFMWCQLYMFYTLQPCRYPDKKKKIYSLLAVWTTIAFWIPAFLIGGVAAGAVLPFLCTLPCFIVLLVIDAYRGGRFLFTYILSLTLPGFSMGLIAMLALTWEMSWLAPPLGAAVCLFIGLLTRHMVRPVYRKAQEQPGRTWTMLAGTSALVCAQMYLLAFYPTPIVERPSDYLMSGFTVLVLIVCLVAIVLEMAYHTKERFQADLEMEQANAQLRLTEAQYSYMEENQEQLRQIRHDMLHHVRIACGLLEEGQTKSAGEYLGHIGELVTMPDLGQYCVSKTGNITISWFAREAARLGIEFHCKADIPVERPEVSADLCMVLANALQNALEASQKAEKNPYIKLIAIKSGNTFLLHVENRFDGQLKYHENGEILSNKEEPDHGLGLSGIRRTTQKYSGYFKVRVEADIFYLEIAMSNLFLS